MANVDARARSNYFKVKDVDKFLAWINTIPGVTAHPPGISDPKNMYCLTVEDGDYGGWPSEIYNPDADEEKGESEFRDVNVHTEIIEHLEKGEVAIFMEIGWEKLRYLTGQAVAVAWDGDVHCINLSDIYAWCSENWGIDPTHATY